MSNQGQLGMVYSWCI